MLLPCRAILILSRMDSCACCASMVFQTFLKSSLLPCTHSKKSHSLPISFVPWMAHLFLHFVRHINQSEPIEYSVDVSHSPDIPQRFRSFNNISYPFNIVHKLYNNPQKYRVNSWSSVCPHGRSYFSFLRISSALIPLTSNFFSTASTSVFLASSAALASAFAFFASRDATSFSAFFRAALCRGI